MLRVWMSKSENCWVSEEGNFLLAHVIADSVKGARLHIFRVGSSVSSKDRDGVQVTLINYWLFSKFVLSAVVEASATP